jgi:glycogenin glucosyltransferase
MIFIKNNLFRTQLRNVFDGATEVDVLSSGDDANLALIGRPDLGVTFTKLHCWLLTQYSKCVFMDADTFVRSMKLYNK